MKGRVERKRGRSVRGGKGGRVRGKGSEGEGVMEEEWRRRGREGEV